MISYLSILVFTFKWKLFGFEILLLSAKAIGLDHSEGIFRAGISTSTFALQNYGIASSLLFH